MILIHAFFLGIAIAASCGPYGTWDIEPGDTIGLVLQALDLPTVDQITHLNPGISPGSLPTKKVAVVPYVPAMAPARWKNCILHLNDFGRQIGQFRSISREPLKKTKHIKNLQLSKTNQLRTKRNFTNQTYSPYGTKQNLYCYDGDDHGNWSAYAMYADHLCTVINRNKTLSLNKNHIAILYSLPGDSVQYLFSVDWASWNSTYQCRGLSQAIDGPHYDCTSIMIENYEGCGRNNGYGGYQSKGCLKYSFQPIFNANTIL